MNERRTSLLGGMEAPGLGIPGVKRTHTKFYMAIGGVALVLGTMTNVFVGLGIGLGGAIALFALMLDSDQGTVLDKLVRASRWRYRGARRIRAYETWSWADWRGHVSGRAPLERDRLMQMRYHPDGADGLAWLQSERSQPGISWQHSNGHEAFLSVTFSVAGRLSGLESDEAVDAGAEAWGRYLGSMGGQLSLPNYVQVTTRVLPPDMAWHERWVSDNLEAEAPEEMKESYEQVLRACEAGALIQRHFITVRWPLTDEFKAQARHFGDGEAGWRAVMDLEIAAQRRALEYAQLGDVEVLTARQVAALILHTQDPDRPLDMVDDVDPERVGIRSHDTRTAHVVEGSAGGQWWHATGMAQGDHLSMRPRDSLLWILPWLTGMRQPIVRSISFHLRVVPAGESQKRADREAVAADTEIHSTMSKGRLVGHDLLQAREQAERRRNDLAPGSQAHGVEWVAYVTVSAREAKDLKMAQRLIEEQAHIGMGWSRITWQNTLHSAAMGATWPLARGLADPRFGSATKFKRALGRASADGADE